MLLNSSNTIIQYQTLFDNVYNVKYGNLFAIQLYNLDESTILNTVA